MLPMTLETIALLHVPHGTSANTTINSVITHIGGWTTSSSIGIARTIIVAENDKDNVIMCAISETKITSYRPLYFPQTQLLAAIHEQIAPSVWEIGPGTGRLTWKMLLAGAEVTTTDLCVDPLTKTQAFVVQHFHDFYPHLHVDLGNAFTFLDRYPEKFGSFDFVVIENVLHLMSPKESQALLHTAYSGLKPNGFVYIIVEHVYGRIISKIYRHFLKSNFTSDLDIARVVDDLDQIKQESGYYYFLSKPAKKGHYNLTALQADHPRSDDTGFVFDTHTLIKDATQAGFHIEQISCITHFGQITDCMDDLTKAISQFPTTPEAVLNDPSEVSRLLSISDRVVLIGSKPADVSDES